MYAESPLDTTVNYRNASEPKQTRMSTCLALVQTLSVMSHNTR